MPNTPNISDIEYNDSDIDNTSDASRSTMLEIIQQGFAELYLLFDTVCCRY